MGGAVLFEDALAARLNLMRPSRATVAAFLAAHPPRLTPGARPLTHICPWRGDGPWPRASRAHPQGPPPAAVAAVLAAHPPRLAPGLSQRNTHSHACDEAHAAQPQPATLP